MVVLWKTFLMNNLYMNVSSTNEMHTLENTLQLFFFEKAGYLLDQGMA